MRSLLPTRAVTLTATLTATLALAAAQPAAAQQPFALDEIVFAADPFPAPAGRTGTAISVLDRDAIEALGDTDLSSVLTRLPGVSVTRFGPAGTLANLRIRGLHQRFVGVYVDGVPINDPATPAGDFDFGALQAGDIERVELLPGAQSAVHGSAAMAGVVWITTRQPEQAEGTAQRLRLLGGSFGTRGASYEFTRRTERMDTAVSLSHLRSDGFSAASAGTVPDGFRTSRLSFSTRYRAGDGVTLGASGFAQRSFNEYDDFGADADNFQVKREVGGRLFAEIARDAAEHVVEVTGYRLSRRDVTGGGAPDRFAGTRLGVGYSGRMPLTADFALAWGADAQRESATTPSLPGGVSATSLGGFVQGQWSPGERVDLSAVARVDRSRDYGTHVTGRIAGAVRATEVLTLRASGGTGFRAPSIHQRFGSVGGNFPFRGDPGLQPEFSRSLDLGADLALANGLRLAVTGFVIQTDNLIGDVFCPFDPATFSCVAGTFNTVQNVPGRSRSRGIEVGFALPLGARVDLSGNYTLTDSRDATGARQLRVPRHDATVQLDGRLTDRLRGTLAVQRVAGRLDFRTDFTQGPIPDYTVVHAAARFAVTERVDLSLRVENLFDRRYEKVAGYAASPRAVHVGLGARF